MQNQYLDLLGMTKKDVVEKLGDECNFYPEKIWTYFLHRNYIGKKTYLVITFENDIVTHINIIKTYGNSKPKL